MRIRLSVVALAMAVTVGIGSYAAERLSPLGRISGAFPLSPKLVASRNDALMALPWGRKLPFLLELREHMKQRSLRCAEGYTPSWAAPLDEVINRMPNPNCFVDADRDLARWIGFVRLGPVLRQPPLRPVPATAAAAINHNSELQAAHFPAHAGVVMLEGEGNLAVLELASGKRLLSLRKGNSQAGRLSPNGRLFLLGDWMGSRAVNAETGATVAELPGVRPATFFWIDDRTAVFSEPGDSSAVMVDFESGRELPLQTPAIQAAVPIHGVPDQFVVGYARTASKFQLERNGKQPVVTRLATSITGAGWEYDSDGVTADGRVYAAADGGLALLDLQTMEPTSIALGLFRAEKIIPTDNPNWIVLRGTLPFEPRSQTRCYVYDLHDRTLAPLACGQFTADQPLYLAPMRKYGSMSMSRIAPARLPYAPARSLEEQFLAWEEEDAELQRQQVEIEERRYQADLEAEQQQQRRLREWEEAAYRIKDPARQQEVLQQIRRQRHH